jgi:hypothetical protein
VQSVQSIPKHAMEALGVEEVFLLLIFYPGTSWGWVVNVIPWLCFMAGERTPSSYRGWVGHRAGLDVEAGIKILAPARDQTPVVQSIVIQYSDWAVLAVTKQSDSDLIWCNICLDLYLHELVCNKGIESTELMMAVNLKEL